MESSQPIWEASIQGNGAQTLDWDVKSGDWSVVVMNADGSAGVDTETSFGAKVSFLFELGLGLVLGGPAFLAGSIVLLVLGLRKPSSPSGSLEPATS